MKKSKEIKEILKKVQSDFPKFSLYEIMYYSFSLFKKSYDDFKTEFSKNRPGNKSMYFAPEDIKSFYDSFWKAFLEKDTSNIVKFPEFFN